MSALEEYKTVKKVFDGIKEEFEKKAGGLFKNVMTEVFEKYPALKTISWTQYTPAFNDGDACTFSINLDDYSIHLNGYDNTGSDDENGEEEEYCQKCGQYISDSEAKFCANCGFSLQSDNTMEPVVFEYVSNILEQFDEAVMISMFTDENKRITINRDGTVKSQEYDPGY